MTPDAPDAPDAVVLINGERLTVLGWGRAILMQVAHPLIAAGIGDHSGFRQGAWHAAARLHATVRAMLALSFGDAAARDRAMAGIRTIHDRVHGRLPAGVGTWPAGMSYSAHDPDLLLWVHVTLIDSVIRAYRALVGPLDDRTCDAYVAAAADGMLAIGVPADRMPRTLADLVRAVEDTIAGDALCVSPVSREIAGAIVAPAGGRLLPPIARTQRLLTVGTLPSPIREMYGYPWTAADDRRLARAQGRIRRLRAWSPLRIARFAAARTAERRSRR